MLRVPDENNNNENTKYTTQPALIVSKQKKWKTNEMIKNVT
jgi:hypothetical protein